MPGRVANPHQVPNLVPVRALPDIDVVNFYLNTTFLTCNSVTLDNRFLMQPSCTNFQDEVVPRPHECPPDFPALRVRVDGRRT